MTLLENYLAKQEERRQILIGNKDCDSFELLNSNPRNLFYLLLDGKVLNLTTSHDGFVVHSFDGVSALDLNASSDDIEKIKNNISLSFIYIKTNKVSGYLLSIALDFSGFNNGIYSYKESRFNPIINKPLIESIKKEYGVDLNNPYGYVDYDKLLKFYKSKINDSIVIEDRCVVCQSVLLEYLKWSCLDKNNEPIRRMNDFHPNYGIGYKVDKCPLYPLKMIYEKLDNESVVFVKGNNKKLNDICFKYFLKEKLIKGNTILLAAKDEEEKNKITSLLRDTSYSVVVPNYYFGDKKYNLINEAKRVITTDIKPMKDLPALYKKNWDRELNEFIRCYHNTNSSILKTGEDTLTGVNKFSEYHSKRSKSIPLDISNYNETDFENDQEFFKFFEKAIYVNKDRMRNNPLYSLKALGGEEVFSAMRESLNIAWNHIDKLQTQIEKANCKEWGFGIINSIETLDSALKKIKIILEYNGFSDIFFDISNNPKAMPIALTLSNLKEKKDQYFEQICEYVSNLSKLDEPLKDYLTLAKSHSFLKRKKGKRLLAATLRDKRDLLDFIVTLDNYFTSQCEFEKKTQESEDLFGLVLYSDEGPKKALDALNFLDEYKRLISSDKRCDKNINNYIQEIFNDYNFREEERDLVRDVELALAAVREDFVNLRDIFTQSFHEETLSFTNLKLELKKKEEVNYIEFEQYVELLTRIKNASSTIQSAMTMFDAVDEPLDNFENDYWYSIYKAIAIEKEEKGFYSPNKATMALCCYEPYTINDDGIQVSTILKNRVLSYWTTNLNAQKAKDSYRYGGNLYPYRVLDNYEEFAKLVSPLQISTSNSLSLSKVVFDYIFIFDPKKYDTDELVLLLSRAKKAIILSDDEDSRFDGYGVQKLDVDSLYRGNFRFSNLSNEFIDELAYGFEENGLELLSKEESKSAMYLSYKDEDGQLHFVVPNCLISDNDTIATYVILNATLIYLGKQPMTIIPSMTLMVNPQKAVEIALDKSKIKFD